PAGPAATGAEGVESAGIVATGMPAAFRRIFSLSPSCSTSNSESSCARTSSRISRSWFRSMNEAVALDDAGISNLHQIHAGVGQHLDARLCDEHIVLDAHAAQAANIGAGLDRKHHAGRDGRVRRIFGAPPADPRLLVHVDAQAVAGPMTERLAEPARLERG